MAADSLGVATPKKMDPSTTSTSTTNGRKYLSAAMRSPQEGRSSSTAGASCGRRVQATTMYPNSSVASSRPGRIPPISRSPTESWLMPPKITIRALGGMSTARAPEVARVPTASPVS